MLRLSKHKNVVGLKEATGDMGRLEELKKVLANQINNKSFLLYSGDDPTAAQFILNGGSGTISVTANIVPSIIAEICTFALQGRSEEVMLLNTRLEELNKCLFIESNPIPVKWILYKLGRVPWGLRLPLTTLDSKYHFKMELLLKEISQLK